MNLQVIASPGGDIMGDPGRCPDRPARQTQDKRFSEVLPWRCRDRRAGSDYPLTAPDGAEPTEEAR